MSMRQRKNELLTLKKPRNEKANFNIQKDDQNRFDPLGANGLHRSFVQPVKVLRYEKGKFHQRGCEVRNIN